MRKCFIYFGVVPYEQKSVSYGHNRLPIDEWTLDPLMTGTLSASQPYFDLEDLPKGAIIKTNDNPPAGLFANYTYAVEYEYEVVETSITRNGVTEETNVTADQETDTTDSAKVNATITNDLTNIEVRKIWAGDSENDHDHETVTVQLYKSSQRPDGVVPATTKEITIQVPLSGFTGGPRTDFAGGYITVLVTGDDGSTRTATLSPENWLATVEVPDISASTGSDINYTVSVTGVDGAIISAASVSGDDTVLAGDTVYLTATMTEQQYIQQFTLKFNNTWWGENNTWTTVDAPTSGSITATITRKDNNQSTTYTLSADNNWGKDGIELDKNTAAGDYLTYKIALSADGTEIVRMNNWNNTEYTASESEDTKTIDYQAIVKQLVLTDGGVTCTEKGFKKQFEPGEDIIITITYGNNSWGAFDVVYQGETIFSFTDSMKGTSGTKIVSAKAPTSGVANISIIQNSWAVDSISASSVSSQTALSLAKSTSMSMKMPKLGLTTRTIMATTAVPNKTFTITGTGDKTPLDAEAVGDPITLSSTNDWSKLWENLPTTDENGNPIYYYVRETSASLDSSTTSVSTSYEYVKHNENNAKRGYAVVKVTNTTTREEPQYGSVKVTKAFVGLPDGTLPTGFKITNSVNGTEFTVSNKAGGSGTSADPYYWTIDNLTLGTEVTFTESGYDVAGYAVATVPTADATTKAVQATATSATTPGIASFTNTYTKKVRDFEFNKIWLPMTANLNSFTASDQQTWPTGAEITVEITRSNDTNFKLTYKLNGTATEFEPETIVGTALTKEQLKLVKTGDKDYNFKLESAVLEAVYVEGTEEKAYVYTVKETNSPTDYAAKHYGKKESDAWKYKQDMVNGAGNGEVIINQETGGYELPSTGGPGTRLFTILGSILILLSGTLLWRRRRWV
jgi:LPXTG-motif cell wall-anchored protein